MANYVTGVNPRVLRWARERSGYSVVEVALSFKKEADIVESWESGEGVPTYNQLEKLAYQLYKRPLAIFFFPEPPEEPDAGESFRTLPEFEIRNLLPDSRYAARLAKAMQIALRELNDGVNPSSKRVFRDIHIDTDTVSPAHAASTVRQYLAVPLDEQVSWKGHAEALKNWRDIIQDHGVFVFKRPFKQKDVSGVCLHDDEFPVIYLNNSTATTRQIFTIFHELAHILLGTNGVTKREPRYIDSLTGEAREIEVFCNSFAAESLVPSEDFANQLAMRWSTDRFVSDRLVSNLSAHYNVSREVILRKLLDMGIVDSRDYEARAQQWVEEYRESRKRGGGGNYYYTQAQYLGNRYLELAFGRYYDGRCTIQQLASYLDVKVKSVAGLEHVLLTKAASP